MTAVNHALTGMVIAFVVRNPVVALPVALVSHYVCDALPHFGTKKSQIHTDGFKQYLIIEALLCLLFVALLGVLRPDGWLLAAVCAFVAAAPDLLSMNRWYKARKGQSWKPNLYSSFATNIQWFERPIGAVVEVAWFIAFGLVLLPIFLRT